MAKKYKSPTVTERVISLGVSMEEEHFQRELSTWHDVVRKAFPQSHIANQWQVSLAEKNGVPYIPKESQKFTTRYQFWKGKDKQRDRGIQVWRDRVAFNLLSKVGEPRTYEDLHELYSEWFPIWSQHFAVPTVRGVTVEYVNHLSKLTVPKFCHGDTIDVGRILTAFVVRGPLTKLVPPFSFQMNFLEERDGLPLRFQADLSSVPGKQTAMRLLFKASTEAAGREIPVDSLSNELDTCHGLILEEFEAFFSDEAKATFKPYDTDPTNSGA